MEKSEIALSVLKEEAAHAREALGRTVGTIYTLYGVVVPAFVGAAAVLRAKEGESPQAAALAFGILLVVAGAISYANSLWLEAHQYLRYKYAVLWPRLYELGGMADAENFFQYQARTRLFYTWWPALIFHFVLLIGTLTLATGALLTIDRPWSTSTVVMAVVGATLLAAALCSTIVMAYSIYVVRAEFLETNPALAARKSP